MPLPPFYFFRAERAFMSRAAIPDPVLDQWIDYKEHNQNRSAVTVYKYRLAINRLKRWLIEEQRSDLLDATPSLLERYCGLWLYQQGVKPQSRYVVVTAVRGFYAWATKMRLLAKNPAENLPVPKVGTALPRPAQLEHAEKILMQPDLGTFRGIRDAAMLSVLIGCGCRVSGLVALNESSLVWVKTEEATERLLIRFCEKGKKERVVPAPLETGLLIRAYLGHEHLEKIERITLKGDRVLFVNLVNPTVKKHDHYGERRRLNQATVDDIIKAYGRKAGLPEHVCHAHAFRHLVGTEMAESDIDLLQRQALLGHQDPKTTEVYTHLAMRKLTASVDKANPMGKIKTPVSDLARIMRDAKISPRPTVRNPR